MHLAILGEGLVIDRPNNELDLSPHFLITYDDKFDATTRQTA